VRAGKPYEPEENMTGFGLRLFQAILGLLCIFLENISFSSGNWDVNGASQMS